MKKEFTKYNSLALKGIAIMMMLMHHCFWNKKLFYGYIVSFKPFSADFISQLSNTFKICVSIFAFISGYGLLLSYNKIKFSTKKNNNKETLKWIVNRLIKTLSGFWIIAILSYIICQFIDGLTQKVFFSNGIFFGTVNIITNFLGLSSLFNTSIFNDPWWYMSLAIIFILIVPIIVTINKKYGWHTTLLGVIMIPRVIGFENKSYLYFLFPMILGMLFADKNIIVKFANFKINKNKTINKCIKFIIETIILVYLYFLFQRMPKELFWEIKYAVIPAYFICYLYEFILDIPIIRNILQFFGKHSMNMFLVHEFIRTSYLTDWLYSFKYFGLIVIVLIVTSLLLSIIIEQFKKLIHYNKFIQKLTNLVINKIDQVY